MRSDALLKHEGMRILSEQLGLVEAERFIALMRREAFDYTEWQRDLFKDVPLDKLLNDAARHRQQSQE
ncbi:hypothetical protein C4J81_07605 [Deltaproteobacteria bacterium Smac51]|nr:hypothetical protein C4J81_07605 [Deltaproteobacteria bacterium Smac51]